MALDNNGNIYCAGYYHDGTASSMLLLKYDPLGNLLWSQVNPSYEEARSVVVDGNGDAIMTGGTQSSGGVTIKYDGNGQMLWTQTVSGFGPKKITVDENNNLYIAGSPFTVVKYNSTGVQQWSTAYPNASVNAMFYKGGSLYVTGGTSMQFSGHPFATPIILTAKYSASTGAQIWTTTYSTSKEGQSSADIVADETGNVYVAGQISIKLKGGSSYSYNVNWVTLKYNATGPLQWAKQYDGNANDVVYPTGLGQSTGSDIPTAITLDGSGNPCVTGQSYTTTGSFTSHDMTTIKYSPAGTQLWVKTYDGPEHKNDCGFAILTTASGSVYITGKTGEANTGSWNRNATTVKYNSSGAQQWSATYDGGPTISDECRSIRLDNGGNVLVSGHSGQGALLIKYSQTGTPKDSRDGQNLIPAAIRLSQNYPNPFNPSTTITYSLSEESPVVLTVYNMLGMEVATLVNERKDAGTHSVTFDARKLESGVYTYTLSVAGRALSRKMVLLK